MNSYRFSSKNASKYEDSGNPVRDNFRNFDEVDPSSFKVGET